MQIAIESCSWKKTRLQLVVAEDAFQEGDSLLLVQDGQAPFEATGVVVRSSKELSFRPLLGRGNSPLESGLYRMLLKRGEDEIALSVSDETVDGKILDFQGDGDVFQVAPYSRYGELCIEIVQKHAPKKKGLSAAVSNLYKNFWVGVYNVLKATSKVDDRKIAFVSDSRVELGGNMEPLLRRMRELDLDKSNEIRLSFIQNNGKTRRSFFKKLELARVLATSKVVFCDDYLAYLYQVELREGQRLVQLWHACGHFKTVGFSRVGTRDCVSPFSNNHRTYTDVIVASENDVPCYAEAFGIPESAVRPLGIPRHDWLLNSKWQDEKKRSFDKAFPNAKGKRVVVFAPTFRGEGKRAASYDYSRWDFEKLASFCRENSLFFIFKMHPFIAQKPAIPASCEDVFSDATSIREINDILPSTDILITDYSSVIYEAGLLGIATVFFAYDLEEYIGARDFYEPYDEYLSGPVVRSFDELLSCLEAGDFQEEKLAGFRAKNFKHLDGKSCDRIIEAVVARG